MSFNKSYVAPAKPIEEVAPKKDLGSFNKPTEPAKKEKSKNAPERKVIYYREVVAESEQLAEKSKAQNVTESHESLFSEDSKSDLNAFGLDQSLITAMRDKLSITKFADIQTVALPHALLGRDLLIKAQTGSGKTLAFLLPLCQRLITIAKEERYVRTQGTLAVIVSPTRELARQTEAVARVLLSRYPHFVVCPITGGASRKSEKASLRKGATIVCATPGRLLDHLEKTESFKYSRLAEVVLDECDQLLGLGFSSQIRDITRKLKEGATGRARIMLASATAGPDVLHLAKNLLQDPKVVGTIKSSLERTSLPSSLAQLYTICPFKMRLPLLVAAVQGQRSIVFVGSRAEVSFLAPLLTAMDIPARALHGGMAHVDRLAAWREFHASGESGEGVLVCTDVAARGLNVSVPLVVHYDPPVSVGQYVHRSGRTARIGGKGRSLLFLAPPEAGFIRILGEAGCALRPVGLETIAAGVGSSERPLRRCERIQHRAQRLVRGDEDLKELSIEAFRTYVRGYTVREKEVRSLFKRKTLHMGHVAQSFCVDDNPKEILARRPVQEPVDHRKIQRERAAAKAKLGRSTTVKQGDRDHRPVIDSSRVIPAIRKQQHRFKKGGQRGGGGGRRR
eukprot:gnl/Dysnectes_brevis/1110_a1241_1638.p1 GENE.gnl/Dysnectes_brevis/1110_a1241_1638~~gnl/Dysnectes_brevis/1110_a1241_1638.p1  ORF type:complete len:622 (-),score=239.75 gnl/Dysnectes_brevis/1110_a1241_1638:62-1927(-)